jgi:hypothetical protein
MQDDLWFSVSIDTWADTPAEDEEVDALLGVFTEFAGDFGVDGVTVHSGGLAGGIGATVSVSGAVEDVWPNVVHHAVGAFEAACEKAGVRHGAIAHVDVSTEPYLERFVNAPAETYLGVSEVAEVLGVSRQRVSELRTSEAFPAPVAELRSGPVWRGSTLHRFVQNWARKPGRPRKVKEQTWNIVAEGEVLEEGFPTSEEAVRRAEALLKERGSPGRRLVDKHRERSQG